MPFNVECSKLPPIALGIALTLLSACATGGSDRSGGVAVCPPVMEYDQAFRERAATELEMLPEGGAIEQMLGDLNVLRQTLARACGML